LNKTNWAINKKNYPIWQKSPPKPQLELHTETIIFP
jgi:hypothetical protein